MPAWVIPSGSALSLIIPTLPSIQRLVELSKKIGPECQLCQKIAQIRYSRGETPKRTGRLLRAVWG